MDIKNTSVVPKTFKSAIMSWVSNKIEEFEESKEKTMFQIFEQTVDNYRNLIEEKKVQMLLTALTDDRQALGIEREIEKLCDEANECLDTLYLASLDLLDDNTITDFAFVYNFKAIANGWELIL